MDDWDLYPEYENDEPTQNLICCYCGEDGLHWVSRDGRWVLRDRWGKIHQYASQIERIRDVRT